jgi:amidase
MTTAPIMAGDPSETAVFTRRFAAAGGKLKVAVKDCLDQAGEVTTSGSRALAGSPAALEDAEVVARLKRAGCAIAGRANMHELAYGVTGLNAWTGTPTNPLYPQLVPGGSSSGSAVAVAAGLVDFAIGTDTGGSVRVPAACCGIVGLKPTFGRVSREGVHPRESSLDCVGVFARDVAKAEEGMAIICEGWTRVEETVSVPSVAYFAPDGDVQIARTVRAAASDAFDIADIEIEGFNAASGAGLSIIGRESWNAVGHLTETGLVGRDVHERLLASSKITDQDLAAAEDVRTRFTAQIDDLLEQFDAIALPAMSYPVPTLLEAADTAAPAPITLACRPFNLSGHPAIALPVGEVEGRPVSLQLVGRKGEDEALCALARTIKPHSRGDA